MWDNFHRRIFFDGGRKVAIERRVFPEWRIEIAGLSILSRFFPGPEQGPPVRKSYALAWLREQEVGLASLGTGVEGEEKSQSNFRVNSAGRRIADQFLLENLAV